MAGANTFIIDGHREIYFCPVAVKNAEMLLGRLKASGVDFGPLRHTLAENWALCDQCVECRALPFCQGGCFARAMVRGTFPQKPFCDLSRIHYLIRRACALQRQCDVETLELEADD